MTRLHSWTPQTAEGMALVWGGPAPCCAFCGRTDVPLRQTNSWAISEGYEKTPEYVCEDDFTSPVDGYDWDVLGPIVNDAARPDWWPSPERIAELRARHDRFRRIWYGEHNDPDDDRWDDCVGGEA